jgi:MFS family permease
LTQHESTTTVLRKNKKVLIASLTGSSIEWFDYFLYGTAAALVFNKIFFPTVDPVIGLILSYLSFSLTFFIRPIGGVLFAHIGDRIGRKKTLVLTLSLMGGATVTIGLLPTYDILLYLRGELCHHHADVPKISGAGSRDPGRAGCHHYDPVDGAALR